MKDDDDFDDFDDDNDASADDDVDDVVDVSIVNDVVDVDDDVDDDVDGVDECFTRVVVCDNCEIFCLVMTRATAISVAKSHTLHIRTRLLVLPRHAAEMSVSVARQHSLVK